MTSVDDELFVLLWKEDSPSHIAVYSIDDYKIQRRFSLPGFIGHSDDEITSCVRYKCLYLTDRDNRCIRRYQLASEGMSVWPVRSTPCGLSVTPRCNLLVTCHGKLVELSADGGRCVREITLEAEIGSPNHGVQLTTGQFVVCHSALHGLNRVCVVGDDGEVARCYGHRHGSDVGQLSWPRYLAVDKESQFIFVADKNNCRVVLLSPTLEFVRYVNLKFKGLSRLYFHQATRRLYVGWWRGSVTVIQL